MDYFLLSYANFGQVYKHKPSHKVDDLKICEYKSAQKLRKKI